MPITFKSAWPFACSARFRCRQLPMHLPLLKMTATLPLWRLPGVCESDIRKESGRSTSHALCCRSWALNRKRMSCRFQSELLASCSRRKRNAVFSSVEESHDWPGVCARSRSLQVTRTVSRTSYRSDNRKRAQTIENVPESHSYCARVLGVPSPAGPIALKICAAELCRVLKVAMLMPCVETP